MMKSLLIDIGNSRLKWALDSESEGFVFGGSCTSAAESVDALFSEQFSTLRPDKLFVSCVGNNDLYQILLARVKQCWDIEAELFISPASGCGLTNAYSDYATLGSDRWAVMVAAFDKIKSAVCVVSSGTAVTVDVVNNEGEHLGGYIIPGYGLMQDCLQQGTQMNIVNNISPLPQFELGKSTGSCIQQGVGMAISCVIESVFETMQIRLPGLQLILTGGDAKRLKGQLRCEASIESHLVLQGLGIIYRSRIVAA